MRGNCDGTDHPNRNTGPGKWSPTKETALEPEKLKTAALLLLRCKYQELRG